MNGQPEIERAGRGTGTATIGLLAAIGGTGLISGFGVATIPLPAGWHALKVFLVTVLGVWLCGMAAGAAMLYIFQHDQRKG